MSEELVGVWTDVGDAHKEPPRFIIEGVLPSGIVFLSGPPKAKKTTLELMLALLVAGYNNLKSLPAEMQEVLQTGRVMVMSAEHSAGELRYMIEDGMGVRVKNDKSILIAEDPWLWRLDDEDGMQRLLGWLQDLKPLLFIIDPLVNFHEVDENSSGEMVRLLRPIRKWAKDNDSCFMVVHHVPKKKSDDKTTYKAGEMRGTGALLGMADGVLTLTGVSDDMTHIEAVYKRGRAWQRTVRLGVWGDEMVEGESKPVVSGVGEALLPFIRRGTTNYEQLAKALKVSKQKVVAAVGELTAAGYIKQVGKKLVVVENKS